MTDKSLPISFLSDFGLADEFVGVVHGVLAKLAPDSRVIDVGHGTPPGDIKAAALSLTRAIQYLPEGVALVVVDPGVGSERKALALETDWGFFVGPDNGVLSPAVAMVGGARLIVSIDNPEARIPSPGETFHGRDVFAPAAALLASGEASIQDLGPEVGPAGVQPLLLPLPEIDGRLITGEAWWVDRFGNVQTNIGPDELAAIGLAPGATLTLKVGASLHTIPWVGAYSDVEPGGALIHVDSAGLIAIAVREGAADEELNLSAGVAVTLAGTGSTPAG
ncbi:MAG TPA: SAM-dependent chlorinase/fluorinase [Acidimicrobiia bacterium]|nr:SAM-dependent chlorinase/fluorinase [Acidimicrobiia bacterium]